MRSSRHHIQVSGCKRDDPVDLEKKRFAWWFYFWFLIVLSVIAPVISPLDRAGWIHWGFELVGIVGLWGYLRRRPLLHLQIWRAYFFAAILSLLYGSVMALLGEPPDPFSGIGWYGLAAVVVVLAVIVAVPLLIGLWRYAFRSQSIWQRTTSRHG